MIAFIRMKFVSGYLIYATLYHCNQFVLVISTVILDVMSNVLLCRLMARTFVVQIMMQHDVFYCSYDVSKKVLIFKSLKELWV